MTSKHLFIAGDWGTSNLRLYLCEYRADQASIIIDTRFGPGVSEINGDFEDKFFNLIQDWLDQYGAVPVLLSGMVGSTIGWKDAPYLTCPVDVNKIANGRFCFQARGIDFSILAGLKTNNPLGSPDVMRGEELQLLGWMRLNNLEQGRRLFALPGTHNKWTLVEDGAINNFLTAFTGELFSLLRRNSILITDDNAINFNQDVFMQAVHAIQNLGEAHLIHALFATRSKQVLGEMAASDGLSYLSGLIAAADIIGATKLFNKTDSVTVIGEPTLTNQYMLVLEHLDIAAQACDPAQIAIAGFEAIYQNLYT
jgi:2-dehydro-3-deoxygalactonokinase